MHDLIIIGAGPAGLTSALYAGRSRLKTLVLEKMSVGGRIMTSETIENYPGFIGEQSTHELIRIMEGQVKALDINVVNEEAASVDCKTKTVKSSEKEYSAKAIIIASGSRPRKLGVPGEERLTGRGVSYCATCDGPLYKDKDVAVVGGGNTVAEEAIYLSRFAKSVTVVHRRNEFRASAILQERMKENKKIKFLLSRVITEIKGDKRLDALRVRDVNSGAESDFPCSGIFVYIGQEPETLYLKGQLDMDEVGFIITDDAMNTSCTGVFACGDCRKKSLYQVVTACGDGAIAADSAYKYIASHNL